MRIGYPCINRSIGCSANRTFRLASWSPDRFLETVAANLDCLGRILSFNAANGIRFFRVTSDLVPFASHPVCDVDWPVRLGEAFATAGALARTLDVRLAMHPDQFVVINSPDPGVRERSTAELVYHARALDALGCGLEAKIQIHAGGLYGDRGAALDRFARTCDTLPDAVRRRLVVENDDRLFPLADGLEIHRRTGLPVLLDVFHHAVLNRGEPLREALEAAAATWGKSDGAPIVDYSSQEPARRPGTHAQTLDPADFTRFLAVARPLDPDVMLEIKDKESSALAALALLPRTP
ncbi:MAG: UV DNA damage repair endonuclease UvsE [Acidobacteria bacterium]|nr:UV DNA damage repair endonuclease UvsE [Acidobacteriota bacterium]